MFSLPVCLSRQQTADDSMSGIGVTDDELEGEEREMELNLPDPSIINASIISAVRGHHGDYHLTQKRKGSRLWISPLMPVYWFFDFAAVVERNLFLAEIMETDSFMEAAKAYFQWRQQALVRTTSRIPLPAVQAREGYLAT
jgi:hypothetical protein